MLSENQTVALIVYTLSDMLFFGLICLLAGAFFGGWIVRESKALWKRPTIGELVSQLSQARGAQVLRSMGLSKARLEENEEEGRLTHETEEVQP